MSTYFFISLGILILGVVIGLLNFFLAAAMTERRTVGGFIGVHLLAMLCYVVGILGSIGFGIAWIVTYLKHG
jgi:hypothetical protein